MEEGVPKFFASTEQEDAYMSIDGQWSIRYNYSLSFTTSEGQMKSKILPLGSNWLI